MRQILSFPALRCNAIEYTPLDVVTRRVLLWGGGLRFQLRYDTGIVDRTTGRSEVFICHTGKDAALKAHAMELELRGLFV